MYEWQHPAWVGELQLATLALQPIR
jgi:hypothetical protein